MNSGLDRRIPCRVLPHATLDGAANMALDEALLESVANEPSAAVLRTYEWSRPTLSLGYFQKIAETEADPRWRSASLVRRSTGGGAIWHDGDLTYSLVIPAGHPLAKRPIDLYEAVHSSILLAMADLGIVASRRGGSIDPGRSRPFLCFLDQDPEDLVLAGSKVVGSAQRRRRGAVLQHGSILLKSSPTTPELPGLDQISLAGMTAWADRVRSRIPQGLGLDAFDDRATIEEDGLAARLIDEVYRHPSWTDRR